MKTGSGEIHRAKTKKQDNIKSSSGKLDSNQPKIEEPLKMNAKAFV